MKCKKATDYYHALGKLKDLQISLIMSQHETRSVPH